MTLTLLSSVECPQCAVPRPFRMSRLGWACQECGRVLPIEALTAPIPSSPAANDRERLAEHGDRAPAPSAGELSSAPEAQPHDPAMASGSGAPFTYGDPW